MGMPSMGNFMSKQSVNNFNVRMIHYKQLKVSEQNFYEMVDISELANSIVLAGKVLENLIARQIAPNEYELISGHRRLAAIKMLVEERGLKQFEYVPVSVNDGNNLTSELQLILANTYRTKSDYEKMQESQRLKELLESLVNGTKEDKEEFFRITGLNRDSKINWQTLKGIISEQCKISGTKVAELQNIHNNLSNDLKEKFRAGEINSTVANQLASLSKEKQAEVLKTDVSKITVAEAKKLKASERKKENKQTSRFDNNQIDELIKEYKDIINHLSNDDSEYKNYEILVAALELLKKNN